MANVLAISTRKFREHQREFLELVDKGTRLIVKRGEDRAYVVTPISMEELYFTPEMEKRIDQAIQSIKDGKGEVMTIEQIEKMLGV
jgi:hypothetical protein